jgi:hypothetical protein
MNKHSGFDTLIPSCIVIGKAVRRTKEKTKQSWLKAFHIEKVLKHFTVEIASTKN